MDSPHSQIVYATWPNFYTIINYFSHHKSSTYHEKKTFRNLHRDLGYFYIGLIISFAFPD
jgi:hypothetical protein